MRQETEKNDRQIRRSYPRNLRSVVVITTVHIHVVFITRMKLSELEWVALSQLTYSIDGLCSI